MSNTMSEGREVMELIPRFGIDDFSRLNEDELKEFAELIGKAPVEVVGTQLLLDVTYNHLDSYAKKFEFCNFVRDINSKYRT
jgi:hypothetical protein